MVAVVMDAEVDLVVGLVEIGIPGRLLADINLRQPLGGALNSLRDRVHPEVAVQAPAFAVRVVRNFEACLPIAELLDEFGIFRGCAAGLQRRAGRTRRPHLQAIRATERATLVVLSARVLCFTKHIGPAPLAMKIQVPPVGAARPAVPFALIDLLVLREVILERHHPMLAARRGYAVRIGGVVLGAEGGKERSGQNIHGYRRVDSMSFHQLFLRS